MVSYEVIQLELTSKFFKLIDNSIMRFCQNKFAHISDQCKIIPDILVIIKIIVQINLHKSEFVCFIS